ncbi:MAG: hypothetical protein WBF38_02800 [Nitrosotalea sp.]
MSSEQEQIKDNQKWSIPQGCGLEKLISILTAIRNKNGDREFVEDERFKTAIDLTPSLIPPNVTFLNSIKLLEKDEKKVKLTKLGNELTEAWVIGDENISRLIQQIIKESHLRDLYDYLDTNKGIKIAKIFSFVKVQARIPDPKDGRPFADIPFQGVKTLIKLFEKANLLSDEQIEDFKNYKNTNLDNPTAKKPRTQREKKTVSTNRSSPQQTLENSGGHLSLIGIEIELNSSKNIKFAIMQLNDLLKEFENKANTTDNESIEMMDESSENKSDSETSTSET